MNDKVWKNVDDNQTNYDDERCINKSHLGLSGNLHPILCGCVCVRVCVRKAVGQNLCFRLIKENKREFCAQRESLYNNGCAD